MPGFASPIELSIPTSVSAIRTGRFPSRGSGVTVFVTKASSARATSGASSASRQPEALRITRASRHGPSDAEALQLAVDLDGRSRSRRRSRRPSAPPTRAARRARARATAWSIGSGPQARTSWPLGSARSVTSVGSTTTSAFGTSAAASACQSLRKPSTAGGPPSCSERYGSGAMPMPPPTSSGRSTSSRKPLPSGPRTWSSSPGSSARERPRSRADRVDQERELAGRREAEAHRPRQQPAGRLEHEELARVRPGRARRARRGAARTAPTASTATTLSRLLVCALIRSWSESACSPRASAIACDRGRARRRAS